MKVRIKFSKQGSLRFIGHLDVMRYFQKLLRRADIEVMYSQGFSPHPLLSFSAPLSLGFSSEAEYADVLLETEKSAEELCETLNRFSVPELRILSATKLPDDVKNAMSLLYAADYSVKISDDIAESERKKIIGDFFEFLKRPEIIVLKKSKTSEKETDIKKLVMDFRTDGEKVFLRLSQGSSENLNPELLLTAFLSGYGEPLRKSVFRICRVEQYGEKDGKLLPLCDYGTVF